MDIDEIRTRYTEFREEREREAFLAHAGRKRVPAFAEVDDRYADITGGEALDTLRVLVSGESFEPLREAALRLAHLVESAILQAERWQLGARLWLPHLHPDEREELLEEQFASVGERRAELGYATGADRFRARYPELDPEAWGRGAERLLEVTEPILSGELPRALSGAGLAAEGASARDVLALIRQSLFDALFPAERALACLDFTWEAWGLRSDALPGVVVDDDAREGRTESCRAFALQLPGEIALSLGIRRGMHAYRELFGAGGEAAAWAFISGELPVERQRECDPALLRGWQLLLEERVADPRWIAESPASARAEEFAGEARFARVLALRRDAARLRFELELSRLPSGHDPHSLASSWEQEIANATTLPADPRGYLAHVDAELAGVHELRARGFAWQLAEHLRERFGRTFWKERRCGELLKELWNTGSTYTADEVARELGFAPLQLDAVIDSIL